MRVRLKIRSLGIAVVNDLNTLSEAPDVIHGQHHLDAAVAALYFLQTPMVYVCHGWLPWQEMPLTYPLAEKYVAVSMLTKESLVTSSIPCNLIQIISNFVDLERFQIQRQTPIGPIRHALAYGNNWRLNDPALEMLRECCKQRNIELEVVGLTWGNSTKTPETVLPNFDLVFAVGRSALEALACGCAVIIADPKGFGDLVSWTSLEVQIKHNFGLGLIAGKQATSELIFNTIDKISVLETKKVSDYVRNNMSLEMATTHWEKLYKLLIIQGSNRQQTAIRTTATYLVNLKKHIYKQELDANVISERNYILEASLQTNDYLIHHKDQLIATLTNQLDISEKKNNSLLSSSSWRLTLPLRFIKTLLQLGLSVISFYCNILLISLKKILK